MWHFAARIRRFKGDETMSVGKLSLALAAIVLFVSHAVSAAEVSTCSNATLHGSYGLHATGELFAAVARFEFDGNGGLRGKFYGRMPGNPFGPIEFAGTYSVSPDCIVTDSWLGSTHVSVIVDGGKGYFILNSTPGPTTGDTVNSGQARRQ
jgi:hypothetical protein